MREKRHFKAKKTSLFGSENEKNHPENDSDKFFSPITVNNCEQKSVNYGDWWKPIGGNSVIKSEQQLYDQMPAADNSTINEIGSLKYRSTAANKKAESSRISSNSSDKAEALAEDACETSPQDSLANPTIHFDANASKEDRRADDFDSEQNSIIEEAKNRAKERQQQPSYRGLNEYFDRTDCDRSSPHTFRGASPNFELAHSTTDNSNEAQKELLERKMTVRASDSPSLRPPWLIDEKVTQLRPSFNPRTVPKSKKKFGFLKSCNQIDFPSYTPEEMRHARPTVIDSRNKKCTWMPSLASDFVTQSDVGKASTLQRNKKTSPRYANGVNLPPYPKLTAPYAMD